MRVVRGFGRFWWDFVVGDDWRIAAGVAGVLAGGAVLVSATDIASDVIVVCCAVGIVAVAAASILTTARATIRASSRDGS